MIRFIAAALFCALAGCATQGSNSQASNSQASTPQAQCEAAAYDDPEVKGIEEHLALGLDDSMSLLRAKNRELKRATNQCLRDKGLAAPGGVQSHAPTN